MPGGSLYDYLHKNHRTLTLPQLVQFAIDVCRGMEYLHKSNIIHRDLKTANLLMDSDNAVKVADFGVARFQNQEGVMTAETGTYRWMAPEVINHQPYDQKADVFRKTNRHQALTHMLLMGLRAAGLGSGSSTGDGDLMVCSQQWSKIENRIATLEFDRDRKSMGVIVSKSGRNPLLVKGAIENLLDRSSYIQLLDGSVVELDKRSESAILDSLNELSSSALRVLGFAYKEDPPEFITYDGDEDHPALNLLLDPSNYSRTESNLIFAGLAGLGDPPSKRSSPGH